MITGNRLNGSGYNFLKGAPEIVLEMCRISDADKRRILAAVDEWASEGHRLIGLAFLERYPTPELGRTATVEDLRQFLHENHYGSRKIEDKVLEMHQLLQAPAPTAGMQEGLVIHVQVLIPLLRHIYHSRTDLRNRILQAFPTHPDSVWRQTIRHSFAHDARA